MYFSSVIVLLLVALHAIEANWGCDGGFCVPKGMCPTKRPNGALYLGLNGLIQDEDNGNCGNFMTLCCMGSSASSSVTETCGISNPQGLMYEVEPNFAYAKYGEFPWTVAIFKRTSSNKGVHVGGGALIHPQFILTATHTVQGEHQYVARFGEWSIQSDAEIYPHKDIAIEDVILPMYGDVYSADDNIALAMLKKKVTYSDHIRPICLPHALDSFVGKQCIATGWGTDVRTGDPALYMKRMKQKITSRLICCMWYPGLGEYHKNICANGAQNICQKDGGSPLACQRNDGSYVLAGIAVGGKDCGRTNIPGVYVDLTKYFTWIRNTIA